MQLTMSENKRSVIFPNWGFQRQLLKLEETLKKERKERKEKNYSVLSRRSNKSQKSIRSTKSVARSETRSNYHSSASAYRGKYRCVIYSISFLKILKASNLVFIVIISKFVGINQD